MGMDVGLGASKPATLTESLSVPEDTGIKPSNMGGTWWGGVVCGYQ